MAQNGHQNGWISKRIEEAEAGIDDRIPTSVVTLLEEELRGTMGERPLRAQELTALAKNLADTMNPQDTDEANS